MTDQKSIINLFNINGSNSEIADYGFSSEDLKEFIKIDVLPFDFVMNNFRGQTGFQTNDNALYLFKISMPLSNKNRYVVMLLPKNNTQTQLRIFNNEDGAKAFYNTVLEVLI